MIGRSLFWSVDVSSILLLWLTPWKVPSTSCEMTSKTGQNCPAAGVDASNQYLHKMRGASSIAGLSQGLELNLSMTSIFLAAHVNSCLEPLTDLAANATLSPLGFHFPLFLWP